MTEKWLGGIFVSGIEEAIPFKMLMLTNQNIARFEICVTHDCDSTRDNSSAFLLITHSFSSAVPLL